MHSFKMKMLSCFFLSLLSSNISLQAAAAGDAKAPLEITNPFAKKLTVGRFLTISALLAFTASLIKYACTEPHNEPIRYKVDEAKTALNEIRQGINVQENLVKLRNFVWYFILDGIIGHGMKKRSIRIDPDEPSKLFVHPGAKSKGLYGRIASYHKGIFAMLFFMKAVDKFQKDGIKGWNRLVSFVGLD